MGYLLGGTSASFVRRHLGVGAVAPEGGVRLPPRAPDLRGRVVRVDDAGVDVELIPRASQRSGRIFLVRRAYPHGPVLNASQRERVSLEDRTTVGFDVTRDSRDHGPWFYECYLDPADGDAEPAFVCESAPYRWADRGGNRAVPADRVTEPPGSIRRDRFVRVREDNDYVLRYRWWDSVPERWSLEYRLRRSVHEAAVSRERGYVRTFQGSIASPVARDLAVAVAQESEREDHDPGGPGSRAERFELLVRFAQDLRYVRDAESMGVYDYARTVEETLVDGVGDCKDKSFLLAGLLSAPPLSCDVALLFQPAHVLIGVAAADVPEGVAVRETIELGGREYVPVDPSYRFPIGDYPDADVTAAYGDGEWLHYDLGALGRGMDRNVRDFLENGTRK